MPERFSFTPQRIPDVLLVTQAVFGDDRGFFTEVWREADFLAAGLPRFVQENHSRSVKGVVRGMHYQDEPKALGKLVRCLHGHIFDVAVDIRRGSPTYGKWVGVELSDAGATMLYVPPGFAHGFCALSDTADVAYKQNDYYSPAHDRGFRWNDPAVAIDWPVREALLSPKDAAAPLLADAENHFVYGKKHGEQAP
jgi:dTDP-4-dehydrorhamnose 3,5-epimerase